MGLGKKVVVQMVDLKHIEGSITRCKETDDEKLYTFPLGRWERLKGMRIDEIYIPLNELMKPEMKEIMYQVILPALMVKRGKVIGYLT